MPGSGRYADAFSPAQQFDEIMNAIRRAQPQVRTYSLVHSARPRYDAPDSNPDPRAQDDIAQIVRIVVYG